MKDGEEVGELVSHVVYSRSTNVHTTPNRTTRALTIRGKALSAYSTCCSTGTAVHIATMFIYVLRVLPRTNINSFPTFYELGYEPWHFKTKVLLRATYFRLLFILLVTFQCM
jgi:hypothetical protein